MRSGTTNFYKRLSSHRHDRLRVVFMDLPETYQEPIWLQIVHGFSPEQISDRLGVSADEVRGLLIHARSTLLQATGHLAC